MTRYVTVGLLIPISDSQDLDYLLDKFHASAELQAQCISVDTNAQRYLSLEEDGSDKRYKSQFSPLQARL